MRLLNANSGLMQDFISDDDIPEYAILSHTWETGQEVTFRQWEDRHISDISIKSGFVKIENFCAQAARDGFEWVWVDTCCIDKTSSAELSEAINAMFRWYQNATACYVHLADVSMPHSRAELAASRWFTRGWTLQELIAPKDVRFYSASWTFIDTKAKMYILISEITGIDQHILTGGDLETISVARRMSWVSTRKTTRIEDIAYCLLGIFDINLPLIYGEGRKAFQRLQEAIMLKTHDQSLFAWGQLVDQPSERITADQAFGLVPIEWKPPSTRQPLLGLLADGPELFRSSSEIEPFHEFSHELRRARPPVLVSGGVLLGLVTTKDKSWSAIHLDHPRLSAPVPTRLAILLCSSKGSSDRFLCIVLRKWGEGYAGRTPELLEIDLKFSRTRFSDMNVQWHVMKESALQLRNGDIFHRQQRIENTSVWSFANRNELDAITWGEFNILRPRSKIVSDESYLRWSLETTPGKGLAITLKRSPAEPGSMGSLVVEVGPIEFRQLTPDDATYLKQYFKMVPTAPPSTDPGLYHSHTMAAPCDSWSLKLDGYPGICIRVERKPLENGRDEAVDVVDFYMSSEESDHARAKRAIATRFE
ncbi:heterokaryon incompatibility protein-domain-containing protein [Cercophora newfieldiana]|uniref:Heterokaryon incompatibility protein-domain-containing protein n=1 Tax=Cercophora newfieldiana TaxID=92897 RepID=A0AA40CIK3_9PEZI|nr:heterokaryon incompatibility protein-domain-containing protein [Cercophora newfieldiana]